MLARFKINSVMRPEERSNGYESNVIAPPEAESVQDTMESPAGGPGSDVTLPWSQDRADNEDVAEVHPSPLTWLPAEEVLLIEPDPTLAVQPDQPRLVVYSRRPRNIVATPSEPQPVEEFINNISRPVPAVTLTPPVQRRRRPNTMSTQAPRQSRRIAKPPPEINVAAANTVCRQLGFAENQHMVSDAAKDKYVRFFEQPLSREHVIALAKLLGKEVPADA